VAIPARYRGDFPGRIAIILPLPEGCLQVYPEPAYKEMTEQVRAAPLTTLQGRRLRRRFAGRSFETELDRQGRILIPASTREKLGLNGAVVIVGTEECLEIWPAEGWEEEEDESEVPSTGQGQVD
jgi:MraZ protein